MKGLLPIAAACALLVTAPAQPADWGSGWRARLQAEERLEKKKEARERAWGRREMERRERGERYHGRLTEEERRELHRDLDRARRDIYRRPGQR